MHFRPASSRLAFGLSVFITQFIAAAAGAQQTTRSQNDPRPVAHASLRAAPINIDGKIDDAAWGSATPITEFNFSRDRSLLFRDRPTNVFQIKGTYWIGR